VLPRRDQTFPFGCLTRDSQVMPAVRHAGPPVMPAMRRAEMLPQDRTAVSAFQHVNSHPQVEI